MLIKKKNILIQLIILLLLSSCVEHKFNIHISPNGSYKVEYSAHGDKEDIQDLDFTIPSSNEWIIHSTINNGEAESYDYVASKNFERGQFFPETFYMGDSIYYDSLLKHPLNINHSNWYFWETYSIEITFIGRGVQNKYPLIIDLIQDINNPPNGWKHQALEYMLMQTLNLIDIDWNDRPIIKAELKDWIDNDLFLVEDSILFEDSDYYKNIGLDIIMQPLSPTYYDSIDSIYKFLEDELQITLDLVDDSFDFEVVLPGHIESSNADSTFGNTLFWTLNIEDYINEDYDIYSYSKINHPKRVKWGIFSFFILLLMFFIFIIRKKNSI